MKVIVSVDINWGIGFEGRLLKRIPEDMRQFKEKTLGKVVVMGKETFNSLPGQKPLKDRVNIVLSKNVNFSDDQVIVCRSIDDLEKVLSNYQTDEVFVIGGASVYKQLLPFCTEAYITKFDHAFAADAYFPNLDQDEKWELVSTSEVREYEDIPFRYTRYINKRSTDF